MILQNWNHDTNSFSNCLSYSISNNCFHIIVNRHFLAIISNGQIIFPNMSSILFRYLISYLGTLTFFLHNCPYNHHKETIYAIFFAHLCNYLLRIQSETRLSGSKNMPTSVVTYTVKLLSRKSEPSPPQQELLRAYCLIPPIFVIITNYGLSLLF